jgi:hypothetical protein
MRLRKLVVDGATYHFGVTHEHHVLPPPERAGARGRCREIFTAYLDEHRKAPLRIRFSDAQGRNAGYPERGVVWLSSGASLNLNTPGAAAQLVRRALALGWTPETARRPFVIEDGFSTVFSTDD